MATSSQTPKRRQLFICPHHCGKSFKTKGWLTKHVKTCLIPSKKPQQPPGPSPPLPSPPPPPKKKLPISRKRRKSMDASLRARVWDTYIGQTTKGICFCCRDSTNPIYPFSYCNTFQAGHIISDANGGKATIGNLLPICRDCNMNMGAENWDDYVARQPHLRIRIHGDNLPKEVIWAATIIQSLARMYLERKNPHSPWRLEWERRYIYEPRSKINH